jgi:hypothetical protein
MAPRTVYANLTDGLQPFSLWDQSLADMGNLGMIPCTAAGTNAIVLTPMPSAFAPNISTPPQQLQSFTFVATATSTGAVTINGLKLYKEDGATQAAANDIFINVLYGAAYNSALNGGAGGYQITFPITSIINPVITGATISNSTISGSTITTSTYNGNTWTAGTGTLTLGTKTLVVSNSLTLVGADGITLTFPTTSATIARTDTGQTFTGTNAFGVLTATTINGNTFTAGTYTLTGTAAKTLNFTNSLTLSGTDGTTMTFPTTSATLARTDAGNTFAGTQNLTSLTASSAVATDASKNLVSVTNNGSGNNVLTTSPVLVTPTLGAATATTIAFSPTTGGVIGTTTNDNTSAGNVGEYVESIINNGSAIAAGANGVAKNLTSISLTAGDWDLTGVIHWIPASTTAFTISQVSISTTTATLDITNGRWAVWQGSITGGGNTSVSNVIMTCRFSLASTTTIFLVGLAGYTTSTLTMYGALRARRVR